MRKCTITLSILLLSVPLGFPGVSMATDSDGDWVPDNRDNRITSESSPAFAAAESSPFIFNEEFNLILDNLLTNFWSPDGDWAGDSQGDATAFASKLLFELAKENQDHDLAEKAKQTVNHEVALVAAFFRDFRLNMDLVIGVPSLCYGYANTGNGLYRLLLSSGVWAGYLIIMANPDLLVPYVFDYATVYGTGSYMCFQAFEALSSQSGTGSLFKLRGLALIAMANRGYWNEEQGLYEYSRVMTWPQATMMMALNKAFQFTGNNFYLNRSVRVFDAMEQVWDTGRGGYFSDTDSDSKGLSENNNMTWAMLDLYELTGNERFLDRARGTIEWILSEDLYDAKEKIIRHDWTTWRGRSTNFCTGCNFEALYNIWRFNRLMAAAHTG